MVNRKTQSRHKAFLNEYSDMVGEGQERQVRLLNPMREIEDVLVGAGLSREQRISIGVDAGWIAGYYKATGAVLCFTDPDEGWRTTKRGLLYSYWHDRIAQHARDLWEVPPGEKKRAFNNVANLTEEATLALTIARPEALWYLDVMERSATDGSLSWYSGDFFAAYLVRLYRKLKGEDDIKDFPPNANKQWEHPFNDLIDCWDDEEKLAEAILRACDYHVRWSGRDSADHEAEFSAPVAILNPIEIHALESVRSELGLSTPKVEHDLLQPPFYPLPDCAKNITTEEILAEDDLLRRIVELNQPWCDGVENDLESPREDALSASESTEEPAKPRENQVYKSDGIEMTSVSGPLTDEMIRIGQGLAHVLSFAPTIEKYIAAGRIEEAIQLFQEVSGASREEAEASILGKNR